MNNRIKAIKRMAYGFRDSAYFFLKIKATFPRESTMSLFYARENDHPIGRITPQVLSAAMQARPKRRNPITIVFGMSAVPSLQPSPFRERELHSARASKHPHGVE